MIRTNGLLQITGTISVNVPPPAPATSGGTTTYHKISAASNNADTIKASPGQVYGTRINSKALYPVYVKFYNKASNPNPAVDTVIRTVEAQAGVTTIDPIAFGLPFSVGIAIAIVKGISDTDNTSIVVADVSVEVDFA